MSDDRILREIVDELKLIRKILERQDRKHKKSEPEIFKIKNRQKKRDGNKNAFSK